MKVLITGAGGFVGSALAISLGGRHEVMGLDHGRFYDRLRPLIPSSVTLVQGDVADTDLLEPCLDGVDTILHFAGGGGNSACLKDPVKAVMTYSYGTQALLTVGSHHRVRRFILASTHSVYSTYKARLLPLKEDDELLPDDMYGALKASAEYSVSTGPMDFIILRFSNIYGWGVGVHLPTLGGAVNNFVRAAQDGNDIAIVGDGSQTMDYLHLKDAVRAVESCLGADVPSQAVFNIGSGALVSLGEVSSLVCDASQEILGSRPSVKMVPAKEGALWPDRLMGIDKARQNLGWAPSVPLAEGVREMLLQQPRVA